MRVFFFFQRRVLHQCCATQDFCVTLNVLPSLAIVSVEEFNLYPYTSLKLCTYICIINITSSIYIHFYVTPLLWTRQAEATARRYAARKLPCRKTAPVVRVYGCSPAERSPKVCTRISAMLCVFCNRWCVRYFGQSLVYRWRNAYFILSTMSTHPPILIPQLYDYFYTCTCDRNTP